VPSIYAWTPPRRFSASFVLWRGTAIATRASSPRTTAPGSIARRHDIPDYAVHGAQICWIGEPYLDESSGALVVEPGEIGMFITFDGPVGVPDVVVSFPKLTFVTPNENVELTA
jgi:hypothetical protein